MFDRACTVALVGVLLAGSACSSSGADPTPTAPAGNRAAEIRIARDLVGPPAVAIRDATQAVVAVLDDLRSSPTASSPEARIGILESALASPLDALDTAIADLEAVTLVGDAPELDLAEAAIEDAVAAASQVRKAARADVAAQLSLAEADQQLAALVETWDQRGSRNEQLGRLAATATAAEDLAEQLSAQDDVAACLTGFARRADAAREIAQLTRELRGYVEGFQGQRFDERRAEIGDGPLTDDRIREADAAQVECWRNEAPVPAVAGDVDEALRRLQDALNPPDLAPGGGQG